MNILANMKHLEISYITVNIILFSEKRNILFNYKIMYRTNRLDRKNNLLYKYFRCNMN